MLNLSVPIYQGGAEYSAIRLDQGNGRTTAAQTSIKFRDQTQANVVQTWGQLQAAKAQVEAAVRQNDASERALEGVRNEAQAGQRTTLDVLNAEQALVNARVQPDRRPARSRRRPHMVCCRPSAGCRPKSFGYRFSIYDPMAHYQQIRDAWFGLRTPDGR